MDKTHQNRSSPQKHTCPYCEIEYCTKANMKRHVKSIHESSLYSCTLCKKSFMYSGNRNRHLKNCHQNPGLNSNNGPEDPETEHQMETVPYMFSGLTDQQTTDRLFDNIFKIKIYKNESK